MEALRDHVDARRVRQHVRATSLQRKYICWVYYCAQGSAMVPGLILFKVFKDLKDKIQYEKLQINIFVMYMKSLKRKLEIPLTK